MSFTSAESKPLLSMALLECLHAQRLKKTPQTFGSRHKWHEQHGSFALYLSIGISTAFEKNKCTQRCINTHRMLRKMRNETQKPDLHMHYVSYYVLHSVTNPEPTVCFGQVTVASAWRLLNKPCCCCILLGTKFAAAVRTCTWCSLRCLHPPLQGSDVLLSLALFLPLTMSLTMSLTLSLTLPPFLHAYHDGPGRCSRPRQTRPSGCY